MGKKLKVTRAAGTCSDGNGEEVQVDRSSGNIVIIVGLGK